MIVLPRRSSTELIGESFCTRIWSPFPPPSYTETTLTFALLAAPKIGGVLPVIAKSILPADNASTCGGPDVKVENATLYGRLSSWPAARSSDSVPPFWSPTCNVRSPSSDSGTVGGASLAPELLWCETHPDNSI